MNGLCYRFSPKAKIGNSRCLWQVTPYRNEVCFDEWMKLDLEYIDKWSLWLNFKILFKTAGVVLTGSGR